MQQKQSVKQRERLKREFQTIRINFIKQGTTYHRFCAENNILRESANKIFNGTWKGEKAQQLRQRLINASKGKTDFLTDQSSSQAE